FCGGALVLIGTKMRETAEILNVPYTYYFKFRNMEQKYCNFWETYSELKRLKTKNGRFYNRPFYWFSACLSRLFAAFLVNIPPR
ncbi:MAG: hypothetical protein K2G02_00210, partial [Phocaeicola sp.]|nr:hypothetical protein [Phocaeicola sp.]